MENGVTTLISDLWQPFLLHPIYSERDKIKMKIHMLESKSLDFVSPNNNGVI